MQVLIDEYCLTENLQPVGIQKKRTNLIKTTELKDVGACLVVHFNKFTYGANFTMRNNLLLENEITICGKKYEATAFIEHVGSSYFGHYICYRRFYDKWICCNDESVGFITANKGANLTNPYMLFYEIAK